MKLLLCALLLPFVVTDPMWTDEHAKKCDSVDKFVSFLDGDYYVKCNHSPKSGTSIEIIGCKSTFKNETMVPIGKEIKEEYDDAPGFEETCVKDGNNVTYSSKTLKSRNQAATDKFCAEKGRANSVFEHEGLLKKCSIEGGNALVEVVGCVYKWKDVKKALLQLEINKTGKIEGNQTVKCVRDGQSAKIIGGEFELCENKEGELIVVGTAYKKCSISKENIYTTELVGCVHRSLIVGGKTSEFIAINSTVALFEDGFVIKKCVIDGDTAKLISGSVDECYNRGDFDFRVDDVYKRCIREGDHYRTEIVGCAAMFEGHMKVLNGARYRPHILYLGRLVTLAVDRWVSWNRYEREQWHFKCVLRGKSAVVLSGDLSTCENRTIGEEFIDERLYKVCSLNDTVYTSETIGCVSTLFNETLPVGKGIQVNNEYNFCEKRENSAQLLTGEEARKAMGEEKVDLVNPVESNATAGGAESQSFNETAATFIFPYHRHNCSKDDLDKVHSHYGAVNQCTVQNGHFVYKPVGCTPLVPLHHDDSFLRFGVRTNVVEDVYQNCEIDDQYSIRIQFEYNFATISTPKARSAPLTCRNLSVENARVSSNCIGAQTEGCMAEIACNDAPANLTKFECDEDMGWIDVETHKKFDNEICVKGTKAKNSTKAALLTEKVDHFCPKINEVDNAVISSSCADDVKTDGCEAEIVCTEGFVHRKTQKVIKKYVCDPHKDWIDVETRAEMSKSPIDRCVAALHRERNLATASPEGYYSLVSKRRDLAWACYFNGRQINQNQSVFINDFVFTCAESKDDRLRLQFEGCSSDDLPANIAESMRSRNIAQCDFSKVNGEAEMFIASL